MKNLIKLHLFLIAVLMHSGIAAQVTDSVFFDRLYYTCRIWGHVKYYHTRVANGSVNWDNILLASLKGIRTAPDSYAFNDSVLQMVHRAGEMETRTGFLPYVPDSLNNNYDLTWMGDPMLTDSVRNTLKYIRSKFRGHSNILVGDAFAGGNPSFVNDIQYFDSSPYPDEGKRILALFRYWNILHYFYPYKHLMDQSWDQSLREFLPGIAGASDALAYNLAFKELIAKINDTHGFLSSAVYDAWRGKAYPPFLVDFVEGEMVVTKVLPGIEIKPGDVIRQIDGTDIVTLRDSLRKYADGSNQSGIEININRMILYGEEGAFPLTVSDETGEKTLMPVRNMTNEDELYTSSLPAWRINDNGSCRVGIVDLGKLEPKDVSTMFSELWNTEGIIFDLRNYPRGTLGYLASHLFNSSIHIANFTTPDITYPGRLYWQEAFVGGGTANPYAGKIIILINENTISQAEYTCMGLEQHDGAVKVGSATAGADGNVSLIYLPGGLTTSATFLGTYYPDYRSTQRFGIVPDVEIHPTIEGIRKGEDEVMEFTLNCDLLSHSENLPEEGLLTLYPNPAQDFLHYIKAVDKPFSVEISDITGQVFIQMDLAGRKGLIDVSALERGIYVVRIRQENRLYTSKIVKH